MCSNQKPCIVINFITSFILSHVFFLSVEKHPFENHDKVYHELTVDLLKEIYNSLVEFKLEKERK